MTEDDRIDLVSLPTDRYSDSSMVRLYAIVHRLDDILAKPDRQNLEWRKKYRTLVCDFLEFCNASTPNQPCGCEKNS